MAIPRSYAVPFQPEAIEVLRQATRANPRDARAHYYLGNVLYDSQPAEAIRQWEGSAALVPGFAICHRNLAVACMHLPFGSDLAKAIGSLERAVAAKPAYPLHFAELDELYELAGTPHWKRLPPFEKN
ncbi:MAG: tetratricopeptide repeat protein [Bryobacterales bacterium]|nr:tetratricopeptide repeat protein [Bryobacterales bacterium]